MVLDKFKTRITCFLFCSLFVCTPIVAQETLFPIEQNDRWGYIDRSGKIVIEPRFEYTTGFSEGLAVIELNGKWGYIDTTGKIVIEPKYSVARPFSEDLARVQVEGDAWGYSGKWGFIDRTGQIVIAPQFGKMEGVSEAAYDFHEGLAMIQVDGLTGFIDKAGNTVIRPRFQYAYPFSQGLARVTEGAESKWGYIDKTGRWAIEPRFDRSSSFSGLRGNFSEGMALVQKGNKYGFIDQTGKLAIEPQFYFAKDFHHGLAKVGFTADSWGYIDKSGQVVWQQKAIPIEVSRFLQPGHTQDLLFVGWSPDGNLLASYSAGDGWIKVWNSKTGQLLWDIKASLLKPDTPLKSPDGTLLASGVKDESYEIREAQSDKLIWTIKAHATSDKRVTSPDGSMIAERGSYGDACVKIFDASSNELIRRLEGHPGIVQALAFSPDGKVIASGGGDNIIRFWNAQTGVVIRTLSGHTRKITSLAFSGDGTKLISGSKDDTVKIWNVDDGRLLRSITAYNSDIDGVETVALSNDGQTAIGSGGVAIKVWDTVSGKQLRSLISGEREVRSLMFSPDNKLIVSAYGDNTVKLWDGTKARLLRVIKGRFEDLRVAVFSPEGRFIATGYNSDSRVELWSVRSGKLIRRFGEDSDYVRSLSFSRDGSMIVTGHLMFDINVWSTRTGKLIKSFKQTYSQDDQVAFSTDGKHIVSGGKNQNILLWNVQDGNLTWSAIPIDWETEKQADEEARKEHAIESALEAERNQKIEAADKVISTWGNPVTITFDHFGEAINPLEQHLGETGKANKSLITKSAADADGVWLRLRNNSSLPISFRTDSSYFPQSGCKGLCDGAEISIQYGIEEANGKPVPWGLDISFESVLPPGASVLFSVKKLHLQNRRTVFVSYSYLKENEKQEFDEYGTARRVSFRQRAPKARNIKARGKREARRPW